MVLLTSGLFGEATSAFAVLGVLAFIVFLIIMFFVLRWLLTKRCTSCHSTNKNLKQCDEGKLIKFKYGKGDMRYVCPKCLEDAGKAVLGDSFDRFYPEDPKDGMLGDFI